MIFAYEEEMADTEESEIDDEDATLDDDVLDEVADGEESDDDAVEEGFGHVNETEEEEEEEEEEGYDEDGSPLEDDAEDVDFDTFDDIDER